MDGFDDLLAPSRQALEDNPFADPFAKPRSSSPDPWATPFASSEPSENAFASSTDHFGSEQPYGSAFHEPEEPALSNVAEESAPSDPLDSAVHHSEDDEDDKLLANPRSPGFRESVPITSFSETATIRPDSIEEFDKQHTAESKPSDTTSPPPLGFSSEPPLSPSRSSSGFAAPAAAAPPSSSGGLRTPLDAPHPTLERSVAALSLGGEALGEWQGEQEQTPWQAETFPTPTPAPAAAGKQQDDDDSDDDKPIMQAYQKQHQHDSEGNTSTTSGATTKPGANGLQPVFNITVDDPQKVGDPIRSFTMYTVHTKTTSPLYAKSSFSVLRRYSDFLWLYETLSANNPGVVVPPVSEKNTFGRFDDQFVRQRRVALEKCIRKIANHPVLSKDADLKMFLESDSFALDIKHRKAEIASEKGGLIASIGQSFTGPRFYETDEWFDRQKVYLDSLESQLRGLVKSIELVSKHRVELATATGEFTQNVTDLSESDVGKQLAHSLAGLADIERSAQDLQNAQAEHDLTTLMATADEYARLINSVRLAFSSRIRVYHAWKNQENELLRTKQTHEKNRAQGKIPTDRLGYSLTQIAEAERRASEAKLEYEQVSKLVKTEMARFEQERIEDFKESLQAFLEGMISRQKELIAAWVNYQQMLLKKVGGGGGSGPVAAQA